MQDQSYAQQARAAIFWLVVLDRFIVPATAAAAPSAQLLADASWHGRPIQAAVIAFQRKHGLRRSGAVGRATLRVLRIRTGLAAALVALPPLALPLGRRLSGRDDDDAVVMQRVRTVGPEDGAGPIEREDGGRAGSQFARNEFQAEEEVRCGEQ